MCIPVEVPEECSDKVDMIVVVCKTNCEWGMLENVSLCGLWGARGFRNVLHATLQVALGRIINYARMTLHLTRRGSFNRDVFPYKKYKTLFRCPT